jgi:hypothetical protein
MPIALRLIQLLFFLFSTRAFLNQIMQPKSDQYIYEYKYLKIMRYTINNLIYCFVDEIPGRSDQPAIYRAALINLF